MADAEKVTNKNEFTDLVIGPVPGSEMLSVLAGPQRFREMFEMPVCRVGILGAGLAGLEAAKILVENGGQNVTVLEGRERLGGRAFSSKFAGHVVENGGELIDEEHTEFRNLCSELGVNLNDNYLPGQTHCNFSFSVEGHHISRQKLSEAIVPFVEKLNRDIALMESGTPEGVALKERLKMTTADKYFREVEIPEWAVKTMEAHLGGEWSAATETGCLVFIDYMGYQNFTPENPNLGEAGFARYTVAGGVTTLVNRMAESILDPEASADGCAEIKLGQRVTAIRRVNEMWEVDSIVSGKQVTHQFDYLLVTIPYPVLRTIDLSGAGLSAERMDAIESVEFSKDGKIHRLVKNSYNPDPESSTTFSADFLGTGATDCWLGKRNDMAVGGKEEIRTHYLADAEEAIKAAGCRDALLAASKEEWDKQFIGGDHNGPAHLVTWHDDPFSRGAYAAWGPGEMERLEAGLETRIKSDPEGFLTAGEAQDLEFNGYMEGALRQGAKAARQIIDDIVRTRSSLEIM